MHETAEDLGDLERLLDLSYSRAGEHLRSIFRPDERPSAPRLVEELSGIFVLHLATTTAAGAPFVAPIDGLFYRGRICFSVPPGAVRRVHLRARPSVSATVSRDHESCVIVHGKAREIRTADLLYRGFIEYSRELYGPLFDAARSGGGFDGWIDAERLFCLVRT